MARFTDIKANDRGGFEGRDNGMLFSASFDLFLIREAMDFALGAEYEDLADGFGPGMGTHSDWSGIRDSSREAKNAMLERALNHLFDGGLT